MRLLTPQLRARIESIVLDAIKRLPPNIKPSDPRFLEWIESLIRYHAQAPMDPADEKPPVLGGVGVADQAFPVRADALKPGYMDSGFVQIREGDGIMWQTAETLLLYANYADDHFDLLYPKTGVDNGAVPPSFANAAKHTDLLTQKPGSYTGKLKWLVSGQYGLWIEGSEYLIRDDYTRSAPANPRLSGEGIYTDADGDYWFLEINDAADGGTATLLETDFKSIVEEARDDELSEEELTQIETHALAIAKKTDTVLSMVFSGDEPAGLPLGYGWHFNKNGHKAAIVCHEEKGGESLYYDATKYVATIAYGTDVFTVSVEESAAQSWRPSDKAVFWKPYEHGDDGLVREHCPLDKGIVAAGLGANIVFYCYYDADDVLQECKYTTEFDAVITEQTNCDPSVINGITGAVHVNRSWQGRVKDSIVIDGESVVSQYGGAVGKWNANYTQKESIVETPVLLACCQGQSISPSGYKGPCIADGFITYPTVEITLQDLCPGDGSQCRIKRTHIAYFSDESWEYWDYTTGNVNSSIGIIFPFDCADGVSVVRGETSGGWGKKYHGSWPSPGREKWREFRYETEACPGSPCGTNISVSTEKYMIYASEPGPAIVDPLDYYFELKTERHFFHGHGHYEREDVEDDVASISTAGPWDIWLAKMAYPEVCGGMGSTQWQGITSPVKSWVGGDPEEDYEIDGDFPEDANLVVGWV